MGGSGKKQYRGGNCLKGGLGHFADLRGRGGGGGGEGGGGGWEREGGVLWRGGVDTPMHTMKWAGITYSITYSCEKCIFKKNTLI